MGASVVSMYFVPPVPKGPLSVVNLTLTKPRCGGVLSIVMPVNQTPHPESADTDLGASVPTVSELFAVVRRQWLPFAATVTAFVLLIGLLTSLSTPTYEAKSEVLLRTDSTAQLFPLGSEEGDARIRSVNAELEYVRSDAFERAVIDAAGIDQSVEKIEDLDVLVSAKKLPAADRREEATTLVFVASAADAEQAASLANSFAETYVEARREFDLADHQRRVARTTDDLAGVTARLDELQEPIAEINRFIASSRDLEQTIVLLQERTNIEGQQATERARLESERSRLSGTLGDLRAEGVVLESDSSGAIVTVAADAPAGPSSPNPARNLMLALIAGLLSAVGVALWRDRADRTLAAASDLETLGLDVLATLPASSAERSGELLSLATTIDFARDNQTQVVHVASTKAGEGAAVVAAELATTLARFGRRVVLLDADLAQGPAAGMFGLAPSLGLTDMLAEPIDALEETSVDSLFLLAPGTTDRPSAEVLANPKLATLFGHLRNHFDVVVVSSPELCGRADSRLVGRQADALVLVAAEGSVRSNELRDVLDVAVNDRRKVIGAVLNQAPESVYSLSDSSSSSTSWSSRPAAAKAMAKFADRS